MILFYPTKLKGYARVKILCDRAGIPYTESLSDPFTIVFNHDYAIYRNNLMIRKLREDYPMINGRCDDVSKDKVNRVHLDVFGYDMAIDPETYTGAYVRKTNLQGDKSGRVFRSTQKRQSRYVYHKLINNVDGGLRVDYRVHVINGEIVWTRKKWKRKIIDSHPLRSEIVNLEVSEQKKILEFCEAMGVDFGELDVLKDDKIYIVDVNDIPGMLQEMINWPRFKVEMEILTDKFKDYVDSLEVKKL